MDPIPISNGVYDLSIDRLNAIWKTLVIGEPRIIRDPIMEEGRVVITKTTNRLMKVKVYVFQPNIDEPGTDGSFLAYRATYKWVNRFKTLVATNCFHLPVEENPLTKSDCTTGIELMSNVIKVMVSGDIVNA